MFQDAANEEAGEVEQAARSNRLNALETKHENWTGEESMQDAVLRMLVDKYKPLRTGAIRTADEKLKKAPPSLSGAGGALASESAGEDVGEGPVVQTTWGASSRSMADVPLLPSVEGHQPWHTTFQVPSHAQSSIKYGQIPLVPPTKGMPPPMELDDKARRRAKDAKKRTEHAGRLRDAKESTLDYKLGIKGGDGVQGAVRRRANPMGMKGWASLVEDKIEVRRVAGAFSCIINLFTVVESASGGQIQQHQRPWTAFEAVY